jgi:hypothetical protein
MAKFTWRHLLSTPLHGMTSLQSAFFLPFLGERLRGRRRALLVAETLVSAETVGLSPLPGEGGAGWVDGQRGQRLVLSPFYPSFFSPLSRGETWGRTSCFAKKESASPSRDGRAPSPLPGEGLSRTPIREQTGWVDGQRDRRLVPATIYPSPRDDLPPVGLFSPLSRGETQG